MSRVVIAFPPSAARPWRFAFAWLLPLCIGAAALRPPRAAWAVAMSFQIAFAAIELLPIGRRSPPGTAFGPWFAWCLRGHVLLQAALMAIGVHVATGFGADGSGVFATLALGLAVGSVAGSQGITFAHELGHSKSKLDRCLAWCLMASVNHSHFMVEHHRGHHPRAATHDDPASARRGESLLRFLPCTLSGSAAQRVVARSASTRAPKARMRGQPAAAGHIHAGLVARGDHGSSRPARAAVLGRAFGVRLVLARDHQLHRTLRPRARRGRRQA